MKKPVVDLRQFRLYKLREPEFSHFVLLLAWVGYFALYILTEQLIPAENCRIIYHPLDDKIPFCEVFLIPYVFWYLLIALSLIYFALYDPDSFRKLMIYLITTQILAMSIYILFPNRQDLRPVSFPRDGFLTRCVAVLYRLDTNTNVCPSQHVAFSMGIASVWLRKKDASLLLKICIAIIVVLICMSVTFIKQHSVLDIAAAIPVCLVAELVTFYYKRI